MLQTVRVRDTQIALGLAYLIVAIVALWRKPDPASIALCAAGGVFSYFTSRTLPPVQIAVRELWRAVGVGTAILAVAGTVLAMNVRSELTWIQIAMAYCCGNRFGAGGLFRGTVV